MGPLCSFNRSLQVLRCNANFFKNILSWWKQIVELKFQLSNSMTFCLLHSSNKHFLSLSCDRKLNFMAFTCSSLSNTVQQVQKKKKKKKNTNNSYLFEYKLHTCQLLIVKIQKFEVRNPGDFYDTVINAKVMIFNQPITISLQLWNSKKY